MIFIERRGNKRGTVIAPCPSNQKETISTPVQKPSSEMECEEYSTHCSQDQEKKSVVFKQQVEARLIEGRKELSRVEKHDMWYSSTSFTKIQNHNRTTLCFMNSGTTIPPNYEDKFCIRGLEGRTRRGLKARARLREKVRTAVLNEQTMQKGECVYDPTAIAEASCTASLLAQQEAQEVALYDEFEARQYCKSGVETVAHEMSHYILKPLEEICRWTF
jgi:hypothetical protein